MNAATGGCNDAHSIDLLYHQSLRRRCNRYRRAEGEVVAFEDQVIQRSALDDDPVRSAKGSRDIVDGMLLLAHVLHRSKVILTHELER
jgi:hypothetical protein